MTLRASAIRSFTTSLSVAKFIAETSNEVMLVTVDALPSGVTDEVVVSVSDVSEDSRLSLSLVMLVLVTAVGLDSFFSSCSFNHALRRRHLFGQCVCHLFLLLSSELQDYWSWKFVQW